MNQLFSLQQATRNARAATGMNGIGTEVSCGLVRVVNVTLQKRKAPLIDPLSDFLPAEQAIKVLEQIAADKAFRVAA